MATSVNAWKSASGWAASSRPAQHKRMPRLRRYDQMRAIVDNDRPVYGEQRVAILQEALGGAAMGDVGDLLAVNVDAEWLRGVENGRGGGLGFRIYI